MSLRSLLSQTATFAISEGATETDAEGNTAPADPVAVDEPCRLEMTDSVEVLAGGIVVLSNWLLFTLPDTNAAAGRKVTVDGEPYRVVGEPNFLRKPAGVHHVESRLVREH